MLELHEGDLVADRFRIESIIGEGGIARVYKVRHVRLGSVHALKYLTLQRPALADRLLLEGRIQAQLQHPNLVRVTDVVEHGGQPCLIMELVAGSNLQILLDEKGAMEEDEALRLFAGVLSAVATAHDVGVLHRDLKPANILLARRADRWIPKVSDFGIAKVATEGLREGETRAGVQMGTPGYMAPEQIEDSAQVDHRADIFALGAVLYEMISGHRPFAGDTAFRTLRSTIEGRLSPIRSMVPTCSPAVAMAIERCLEVEMVDRYADCHALADALFEGRPELRALVRRLEADAVPEGLHRPELRTVPTSGPSLTRTPSDIEPSSGATLAPADEMLAELDPGPTTAPTSDTDTRAAPSLLGGINPGADDRGGPSLGGSMASVGTQGPGLSGPSELSDLDAAATPAGGADSGQDAWADDDTPKRRRASPLPWILGAAAMVLVIGAGWVWSRGDGGPSEEVLAASNETLGEPVPLQAEPGADAPSQAAATPGAAAPAAKAPAAKAAAAAAAAAVPVAAVPVAAVPASAAPAAEPPAADAPAAAAPAPTPAAVQDPPTSGTDAASTATVPPAETPASGTATPTAAAPPADGATGSQPEPQGPETQGPTAATETPSTEAPGSDAGSGVSPDSDTPSTGDAVADATTAVVEAPETTTTPEAAPPAAPMLTGTWSGTANDKPLTLRIFSQDDNKVTGEVRFTQGANQRVWTVSGTFDAGSNRLSLIEKTGSVTFTALVRGSGMMGTYGRSGKEEALSWSATRQ